MKETAQTSTCEMPASIQYSRRGSAWIGAAVVALSVFVAFGPSLSGGFVWDDTPNIVANESFRGLEADQVRWAFSTFHLGHYQPLSWLSLGFDFSLWGMNPFGYHLTNLILHCGCSVLVYFLLVQLIGSATGQRRCESAGITMPLLVGACAGALFFGLHPLRVESVAWVTERRDVLSAFFLLACLLVYGSNRGEIGRGIGKGRLAFALGLYLLSLLAKAGGITLPVVLLLLDWYPLRRFLVVGGDGVMVSNCATDTGPRLAPVVGEKLLFLVPAVVFTVIAGIAQADAGATALLEDHTAIGRVAQACYGLTFYAWKTILPTGLVCLHELKLPLDPFSAKYLLSYAVVLSGLAVTVACIRRRPSVAVALVCYAVLLSPILGFLQSGSQEVAERYSYLPCACLAALVGGWLSCSWHRASSDVRFRRTAIAKSFVVVAVLVVFGQMSWAQSRVWHSDSTLWSHAAEFNHDSRITFKNLGHALEDQGDTQGAIDAFRAARRIEPLYPEYGLARLLMVAGRYNEAVADLRELLIDHPNSDQAYTMLADALLQSGDVDGAVAAYEDALRITPGATEVRRELAILLHRVGRLDESARAYELILVALPNDVQAHLALGFVLNEQGRSSDAQSHWRRAVKLDSTVRQFLADRGHTVVEETGGPSAVASEQQTPSEKLQRADQLADAGLAAQAIPIYLEVIRNSGDNAVIRYKLGLAYSDLGQYEDSIQQFNSAIKLNPSFAQAHDAMGQVFGLIGDPDNAAEQYRKAVALDPEMLSAYYNLAVVLGHLREHTEAVSAMEKALSLAEQSGRDDLVPRIRDRLEKLRAASSGSAVGGTD